MRSRQQRQKRRLRSGASSHAARTLLVLLAAASIGGLGWWLYPDQSKRPARVSVPASFRPTVENARPATGSAPEGIVFVPGGEFSMGAAESPDMNMVGMEATTDSRPIHRVYVDGFWMDESEVTNAQFAAFVEGHRVRDDRRADPAPRISWRTPGESRRRCGGVLTAQPSRTAEQSFSVVVVREACKLAPSRGPGEQPGGPGAISRGPGRVRRCGRVRGVGRQTSADRSGVGVRRSRWVERQTLRMGRRVHAERPLDGQHLSGALPRLGYREDGYSGIGPVGQFAPTAMVFTTSPGTCGSG